jgi:hypothetical protein
VNSDLQYLHSGIVNNWNFSIYPARVLANMKIEKVGLHCLEFY